MKALEWGALRLGSGFGKVKLVMKCFGYCVRAYFLFKICQSLTISDRIMTSGISSKMRGGNERGSISNRTSDNVLIY